MFYYLYDVRTVREGIAVYEHHKTTYKTTHASIRQLCTALDTRILVNDDSNISRILISPIALHSKNAESSLFYTDHGTFISSILV